MTNTKKMIISNQQTIAMNSNVMTFLDDNVNTSMQNFATIQNRSSNEGELPAMTYAPYVEDEGSHMITHLGCFVYQDFC